MQVVSSLALVLLRASTAFGSTAAAFVLINASFALPFLCSRALRIVLLLDLLVEVVEAPLDQAVNELEDLHIAVLENHRDPILEAVSDALMRRFFFLIFAPLKVAEDASD